MSVDSTAPAVRLAVAPVTAFGIELQLDLAGCSPTVITSPAELCAFTELLCERIGMTAYGQPMVERFGEGNLRGWTVVQLITTSNINVHAVEVDNSAFVNIFSCRPFDHDAATAFTASFFEARAHTSAVRQRRAPEGWS